MAKKRTEYLDEYLEHKPFEYDYKSDPIYSAMKKQYLREAERTAEDLLGKYSAISGGGSPSSAAVTAATAGANLHKSKLSDAIPTLYDLAWDMYVGELDAKRQKYNAILNEDKFAASQLPVIPSGGEEDLRDEVDNGQAGGVSGGHSPSTSPLNPSAGQKQMDDSIFDMTKQVISSLVKGGNREQALAMLSSFNHSMSESQKKALQKIIDAPAA